MKKCKKIKILLVLQIHDNSLLNKYICEKTIMKHIPSNSIIIRVHNIFFIKEFFNKKNKKILLPPYTYHIYNVIPFIRFGFILYLNILIKKFLIWLLIKYSFIKNSNLVIFSSFNLYSFVSNFNPELYLVVSNFNKLILNKQIYYVDVKEIYYVEEIRQVAIKSKLVFTTTVKETKEMKRFNKNVVQISSLKKQ